MDACILFSFGDREFKVSFFKPSGHILVCGMKSSKQIIFLNVIVPKLSTEEIFPSCLMSWDSSSRNPSKMMSCDSITHGHACASQVSRVFWPPGVCEHHKNTQEEMGG